MIYLIIDFIPEEFDEVSMCSGNVLLPRLTPYDKEKLVISISELVGPPQDVPPLETPTVSPF